MHVSGSNKGLIFVDRDKPTTKTLADGLWGEGGSARGYAPHDSSLLTDTTPLRVSSSEWKIKGHPERTKGNYPVVVPYRFSDGRDRIPDRAAIVLTGMWYTVYGTIRPSVRTYQP